MYWNSPFGLYVGGAQNGIFWGHGYFWANTWRSSAIRSFSAWLEEV